MKKPAQSKSLRPLAIKRAFFIKLGSKGKWEADSIQKRIMRFGWGGIPLADILANNWEKIRKDLARETSHAPTLSNDFNRLRDICFSDATDIWITFHQSKLYWCQLSDSPVEQDQTSKFRRTLSGWKSTDIKGLPLISSQIPGIISKVQGYRGTVCSVEQPQVLERLLNGEPSPDSIALKGARDRLVEAVIPAIRQLHWKDFETLVDLIFRAAGWKRISVLGETKKDVDIELEEPFTRERYQVQIKASASLGDFRESAASFSPGSFRHFYFVVHTPSSDLRDYKNPERAIKLVFVDQLAEMTVRAGLTDWLITKVW